MTKTEKLFLVDVALGASASEARRAKHGGVTGLVAVGLPFVLGVGARSKGLVTLFAPEASCVPVLSQGGLAFG